MEKATTEKQNFKPAREANEHKVENGLEKNQQRNLQHRCWQKGHGKQTTC
jgi:hypothetical protein